MSTTFDDASRDHVTPNIGNALVVVAPIAGDPWLVITPPSVPAGDFRSYVLVLGPAAAAYEVTWKPAPDVADRGVEVPASTFWTTPRMATPGTSSENGWPSFRAIGAGAVTVRGMLCRPVP